MNKIQVSGYFYIFVVIGLYLLPVKWLLGWVAAVAVHEAFHYLALRLCGVGVLSCEIGPLGAVIETDAMKWWQEFLSTLAGPLGGSLLILTIKYFPQVAVCGVLHSIYNLLPIYPLDGGRLLRCAVGSIFTPKIAFTVCRTVEWIVSALILAVAVYLSLVRRMGLVWLVAATILLVRSAIVKLSCKRDEQIVQ